MQKADYEGWGPGLAGFNQFWEFLTGLTRVDAAKCCKTGQCGDPSCSIRNCAREKGLHVCTECDDYPCRRIETLAHSEATLVHDGMRMKEIGIEAWVQEQEARKKDGFCYADVRCGSCVVPRD